MRQNKAGAKDCQGEMFLRENSPRMGSRDEGLTRCWDEAGHSPTASQLLPTVHSSFRDISSTESYTLPHDHHHIFAFTSGNNSRRNRKALRGPPEWELYKYRNGLAFHLSWVVTLVFILHSLTPNLFKPLVKRIYKPGVVVHTFDLSMWGQLGSLWIGFETQLHSEPEYLSLGYSKHCSQPPQKKGSSERTDMKKQKLKPLLLPLP